MRRSKLTVFIFIDFCPKMDKVLPRELTDQMVRLLSGNPNGLIRVDRFPQIEEGLRRLSKHIDQGSCPTCETACVYLEVDKFVVPIISLG